MHKSSEGLTDKARQDKEDESSASSLLPRIHLPGHKTRHARDSRDGNGRDKDKDKEKDASQGHHFPLHRSHSHRHTKSEIPHGSNGTGKTDSHDQNPMATIIDPAFLAPGAALGKTGSGMLSRVTSNLSGKAGADHKRKPRHQYSSSDVHKGFHAAAAAALTGNAGRPDLRRRATSDPKSPAYSRSGYYKPGKEGTYAQFGPAHYADGQFMGQQQQPLKPMGEIEVLLYRAEKAKRDAEENVTEADVQKLSTQLAESNVELQGQLESTNRTASSLMRRLDDAHDALRQTASSLIDTISSFQNLCQQSGTLIKNFENKAGDLDSEMRNILEKQRGALFDERGNKVADLEERGKKANERAEEMSKRLENCRTIVKNYTERQHTKRRAWKGVLFGCLWGVSFIVLGLLLGFGLWWYKHYGGLVRYDVHEAVAIALDYKGPNSVHGQLHKVVKERLHLQMPRDNERVKAFENVPDDVKDVLEEIAGRHNGTMRGESTARRYTEPLSGGGFDEDEKLKKLFDKLQV